MFRIQKLMIAEYPGIYEPVIVENPFTQVTECGKGIRQFQIGLTRCNILFGCDDFDNTDLNNIYGNELDPEVETLELVCMLPLQFVRFNFFRKQNRHIMRIVTCGDPQEEMFFEFGGHLYKSLFWNTWRERIATIKVTQPNLMHLTGSLPLSSSDEEICYAQIHVQSIYSLDEYSSSLCVGSG